MQRWEHLVITLSEAEDENWDQVRQTLDRYGDEGWELVTYSLRPMMHIEGGTGLGNVLLGAGAQVNAFQAETFAIFKRPMAA